MSDLKTKTRAIQQELMRRGRALPRFGVDGAYGNELADAMLAELNVDAGSAPSPKLCDLVTGRGVDIRKLFIHCTATRAGQDIDAATIRRWHLARRWSDIGYHFVIRLDGTIERGRAEEKIGAHVGREHNRGSLGIVYVGGLDAQGQATDTRTPAQLDAMARLVGYLLNVYPHAEPLGHRDISPDTDGDGVVEPHEWLKDCPCFDVRTWWNGVQ